LGNLSGTRKAPCRRCNGEINTFEKGRFWGGGEVKKSNSISPASVKCGQKRGARQRPELPPRRECPNEKKKRGLESEREELKPRARLGDGFL